MSYVSVKVKKSVEYKDYVSFLENYKSGKKDDQASIYSSDSGISLRSSSMVSRNSSSGSINSDLSDSSKMPSCTPYNAYLESYRNKRFSSVKPVSQDGSLKNHINTMEQKSSARDDETKNNKIVKTEVYIELTNPERNVAQSSENFEKLNVNKPNLKRQHSVSSGIKNMINTFENKQTSDEIDNISVLRRSNSLNKSAAKQKHVATIQKLLNEKAVVLEVNPKATQNANTTKTQSLKKDLERKISLSKPPPLPPPMNNLNSSNDKEMDTKSRKSPPLPPFMKQSNQQETKEINVSSTASISFCAESQSPPLPPQFPPQTNTTNGIEKVIQLSENIKKPLESSSSVSEFSSAVNIPPPPPMMPQEWSAPKQTTDVKKIPSNSSACPGKFGNLSRTDGNYKKENSAYCSATLPRRNSPGNQFNVKTNASTLSEAAKAEIIRKQAYAVLRGMYGEYHDQANDYVSTLPRYMVKKDNGLKDIINNIASQGGLEKLNGRVNPKLETE